MEMKKLNTAIRELLTTYNHANSEHGVGEILRVWFENKANLINTLCKHPNWKAEDFRIVFSEDYFRPFNKEAIREFIGWMSRNYVKQLKESYVEPQIDGKLVTQYIFDHDKKGEVLNLMARIQRKGDDYKDVVVGGKSTEQYQAEWDNEEVLLKEFFESYRDTSLSSAQDYYLTVEEKTKYDKLYLFIDLFRCVEQNTVTEEFAKEFAKIYPDVNCVVGTRIVKIVRRVCTLYGLDKIKEMKTISWTDDHGNEHSREVDEGYNKQIAVLGDEINPLKITRHTIISVNPLDYLTMSFGRRWASCHTIDKENLRNSSNTYEGQYCSGTLSYLLDKASVIFYTVESSYSGNEFETQDKIQRVMFHFNEDFTAMVEGRVYPDGRDGGDASLAAQFRNVMQKVISDCTGHNNLWILKKGTHTVGSYVRSRGTHYRDYTHYDDCNVSLLKGYEDEYKLVEIGHDPICPNCGQEHTTEEWLACEECHDHYYCHCANCGQGISEDNYDRIYCEDNDNVYCDSDCADSDGVHWCEDDDEWHDSDNSICDDYDGNWYHECEVETEDGHYYHSSDNARAAGYACTDDDEWYPEDEVLCDEYTGRNFHRGFNTIEINGNYYEDYESATGAGFFQYDGEWYPDEDVVTDGHTGELFPSTIDGVVEVEDENGDTIYFLNEDNAIAEGYSVNADGEWIKANAESEVA